MTTTTTGATQQVRRRRVRVGAVGPLIALAILIIVGSALNDHFLTLNNMANIVARASFIGIIAIGATFVITSGGIDLSVGSLAAFIAGMIIIIVNGLVPSLGNGWTTFGAG